MASDFTATFVAKYKSGGVAGRFISAGDGVQNWLMGFYVNLGARVQDMAYWNGWFSQPNTADDGLAKIYTGTYKSTAVTEARLYKNATLIASTDAGVFQGPAGISTASYMPGDSEFADMYMCEIAVYNRVLTTQERTDVVNYLNTRWAVF